MVDTFLKFPDVHIRVLGIYVAIHLELYFLFYTSIIFNPKAAENLENSGYIPVRPGDRTTEPVETFW